MAKSYVLKALRILGLEEILKLSQILLVKEIPLKKAAGDELMSWPEEAARPLTVTPQTDGKVLKFPKEKLHAPPPPPLPESGQSAEDDGAPKNFLETSEMILWQREFSKESEGILMKQDAVKNYQKSTEMYVVKSSGPDGKEKVRFAATHGVLVNKKQA